MIKIEKLYKLFINSSGISTDSRTTKPNELFFALKGDNFDGNKYAIDALGKGATFAIIDSEAKQSNEKLINVTDSLQTLQQLANFHKKKIKAKILAITGSNGKTTTKELCKEVLASKYITSATAGNLNNHIGVPLTLLSFNKNTDIGIVEMGANHPGEIADLCRIAEPEYGLITNIGEAHLDGFKSIEGVAKAKGELFNYLMNNNGAVFLNMKDKYLKKFYNKNFSEILTYNDNKINGELLSNDPYLKIKLSIGNKTFNTTTSLTGSYNIENICAALCVGLYFEVETNNILKTIENYKPINNRSQLIKTNNNRIFLDAYNANPSSMRIALENFYSINSKHKLFILGEMLEVGERSEDEHLNILKFLHKRTENVICVGKHFIKAAEKYRYPHFINTNDLMEYLLKKSLKGFDIFIKGSRLNQLEKVISVL